LPAPAVPTTKRTGGVLLSLTLTVGGHQQWFINPPTPKRSYGPSNMLFNNGYTASNIVPALSHAWDGGIGMSDENDDGNMPPPPPGLPPAPPEPPEAPPTPPTPPGLEPPTPPTPPGLEPPAPPEPPEAPPAPPTPPGLEPPAPPEPPEAPDAPPSPPGLEPPAPPEPPEAPAAPPAPPGLEAPAPPEPPEAPPAPPGLEPSAPPEMEDDDDDLGDPMELLGDFGADDAEDVDGEEVAEPPMPPGLDLLAPPEPPAASEDEVPPAPPALDLLTADSGEEDASDDVADVVIGTGPSMAGGKIRSASDVDAIPGHKLVGTLEESEEVTLTADGEMVKQSVKGVLTLKNPSDKDRLWDIDVALNDTDFADISSDLPFSELEAGADQAVDYSVEGPRMLCVRERIDTNPSRNQERSLSVERSADAQDIELELEVENMSPVQLNDIIVTRTFPIEIQVSEGDGYEKQGDTVTWNVGRLSSGESRKLSIPTAVTAEAVGAIDAGHATATYAAEATLSGMNFNEVDAHCRGFSYMVVDEDERPDNYRCQAVFENRSSFTVDLTKLTVSQTGADEHLFEVEDVEDDVLPDGRWESGVKIVHSTEKPTFSQELLYTVLPRVSQGTEGTVKLQPLTIEVLEAEVEKSYSIDVLRHYRQTELMATMDIENTGSATINLLRITDDIPGIFDAPDVDSVKASIDGNELIRDQFRIELKEGISLEENRTSPDGPGHTMLVTIGTKGPIGLAPGHKMCITYPLVAPDPSPANDVVAAPARIDFSSERFGPVATRGLNVVPAVRVTHRKVNYDSGKEVFPAGGAGRYEAMIMFNNRADSALKDVVIHDVIPGAFELLEWKVTSSDGSDVKCDMTEEATTDGKKMSWNIGTVSRGQRIEVTYEFKGDAETGFKVSDAQEIHGIDVGAEIEDDAPPEALPMSEPDTEEEDGGEEEIEEEAAEEVEEEAEEESTEDEPEEEVPEEDEPEEVDEEIEEESTVDEPEEDDQMDAALAKLTGGDTNDSDGGTTEPTTCPICNADVDAGMKMCPVCSYTF